MPSTSLDLYFSIYAESSKELSNNNYTIYPSGNIASIFAGKTMGRFLDIFPVQQEVINTEIYDRESSLQLNEELTNINIQPIRGKSTNVMSASNKFNYEISIASTTNPSKNSIDIDDIYIYSDGAQFHLISKSKDKLIFPMTSHMANHQFGMPNVYRFLLDLAAYKRATIIPFNWGEFEGFPYLPKLKSGNLVIQNKLWNIDIRKESFRDIQTLSKLVQNFFTIYKVPRFIKIIDFDNYIFIDTHSESMFELFINELSKKRVFQFMDADEMINTSVLSDKHTQYVNEIICSSFLDNTNKSQVLNQRPLSYYSKENRFKDLGNEWLYLKLYHPNNLGNDLLIYYISDFIQKNKLENHFYFIRYADPYPHIRLRIKMGNQLLTIIERINEMINILRGKKLIINATFDGYNREIERYGGQSLIKYAENIFCKDSLLILNLLPAIKKSKTELEYYSLITLDILLKSYLGNECSFKWLEKNMSIDKKYYKDYRKLFKDNKNIYLEVVKEINFTISSDVNDLNKLIQDYSKKYLQIHSNKEYYNQIVLSFLHMHLNRYGIHSEREQRVMNFLYFMKKEDYMRDKKR
ncbi:thiopeptide-type bacteriocin biosynthesis protein [Lysinibacillus sp. NPDC093712]|uniref:lantibiotic dehydratase n=1 Tax=Lysinibacillus sp. NPDC093712 TaxID=3390579 RepID=UPI003CFFAF38